MPGTSLTRRIGSSGRRPLLFCLLLLLLLPTTPLVGPPSPAAAAIDPAVLVQVGASEGLIPLIVQSTSSPAALRQRVRALDGRVTRDLGIIHALAIEIPADRIPALAASEGVRWIAADPEVQSATTDVESINLYLYPRTLWPSGDMPASPAMSMHPQGPEPATLFNYDSDRDGTAGLLLLRGGSGPDEGDPTRIQRFHTTMLQRARRIDGRAGVKLYAALRDFQSGGPATIRAALIDVSESGAVTIAEAETRRQHWRGDWERLTIDFGPLDYTVEAGHRLDLAITVDGSSSADVMLAFGTRAYASFLRLQTRGDAPHHYRDTIRVSPVWAHGYEGQGIGVAILDSGVAATHLDLRQGDSSRVVAETTVNPNAATPFDELGHGTYIAGLVGGNGTMSARRYGGVAPAVNLLNVRAADASGAAQESDLVAGLQWVLDHKEQYNIRVVNLSMNSTTDRSYHESPLDAAIEILWFNGIVVVVSAGNNGEESPGTLFPPANDPFAIVVGATDDLGTATPRDDSVAAFSAAGTTPDGFARPDLVAPGSYVVSTLPSESIYRYQYGEHVVSAVNGRGHRVENQYFMASGTSAAAAIATGSVALLLSARPDLDPDQVKYLMGASARPLNDQTGAGAGLLDVTALLRLALRYDSVDEIPTANTGQEASQLLWSGSDPINWGSVNWGSVNWGSVNWGSVNWGSVNWGSVNWGSLAIEY